MILVIDNYDSFTYNLVQYVSMCGGEVEVRRNDAITLDEISAMRPSGILLSPGPSDPASSGICLEVLRAALQVPPRPSTNPTPSTQYPTVDKRPSTLKTEHLTHDAQPSTLNTQHLTLNAQRSTPNAHHFPPVFGVCLGHQAIGAASGAIVRKAGALRHGKTSPIRHDGRGVFAGMPNPFEATRYHSLVIDRSSLSSDFEVTATSDDDGEVMGIRHRTLPIEGVQFHPESILTEDGLTIVRNFVDRCAQSVGSRLGAQRLTLNT